jgi:SAM-dependent methyltransferase
MSEASRFWQARLAAHGHTGWNDPIVYAYDQPSRLALVDGALPADAGRRTALDFGCGTGDFSRLLLARGFTVWAYDPFVRPAFRHPRFHVVAERGRLTEARPGVFDVVLSVTVLDHILDAAEFGATLAELRPLCDPAGRLIMIEYAPDSAVEASAYQAFRTLPTWQQALAASGWRLERAEPIAHPQGAPTPGFVRFRRRRSVRLLARLARQRMTAGPARSLLNWLGRRDLRRDRIASVRASPLKLMVARPAETAGARSTPV